MQCWKFFLLPLMSLTSFNSSRMLAFLILSLHMQAVFLYPWVSLSSLLPPAWVFCIDAKSWASSTLLSLHAYSFSWAFVWTTVLCSNEVVLKGMPRLLSFTVLWLAGSHQLAQISQSLLLFLGSPCSKKAINTKTHPESHWCTRTMRFFTVICSDCWLLCISSIIKVIMDSYQLQQISSHLTRICCLPSGYL